MRVAVVGEADGGGLLQPLTDDGAPAGAAERVADLAAAVAARERSEQPRWVWPAAAEAYPPLVARGVQVARCHDLDLAEAILVAHEGRWGEPHALAAAWARLRGLPLPRDLPLPAGPRAGQAALFDRDRVGLPEGAGLLEVVVAVHAAQQRRVAAATDPDRLGLLVAAESAGGLAAVELAAEGLPWRADVHDRLLGELLGPRPGPGQLPPRLAELAERICEAFGGRRVNPDSPAQVTKAFAAAGVRLASTRSHLLRTVDHPAAPLLLAYKELSRVWAAHGWAWLGTWVRAGRFRPEYVPGGVVSGRWATRGGGALQIPHALRRAVVADPGWVLVVADAAQLEPRVLAALSGDERLARAAGSGDLYAALAADAFRGDRARAKVALLAALYGQVGGEAARLLGVLRRRFPEAFALVESAARAGEEGALVRSRLGRTCPPPSAAWQALAAAGPPEGPGGAPAETPWPGPPAPDEALGEPPPAEGPAAGAGPGEERRRALRDRGRFTRNFVVQASAADWALVWLAAVRRRLAGPQAGPGAGAPPAAAAPSPRLVFFQHDEVVVHCPAAAAASVVAALTEAGEEASRLVFGDTPVRFPLDVAVVGCYADAK